MYFAARPSDAPAEAWHRRVCSTRASPQARRDAEFDTEDRMLFPHEILSSLRLREWMGLSNPAAFEHPLMRHPMARMPNPVPLPQPDTPLLDAVVAKFKTEFPGSFDA